MWITTKRLILRPWEDTQLEAERLYEMAKDPLVGPAAGWPPHRDVKDSRRILRNILCTPEIYAVVPKKTARPCGAAGITLGRTARPEIGEKEAEIGYWIASSSQGMGYATEAVHELLRRCFEQLGRSAVWCAYYEGNERSHHVQEKCGFRYHHTQEHTYIDLLDEYRTEHFMKITKKQWREFQSLEPDPHMCS